ncbi:MAG: protein kinase [Myxococcales bacterium]|nr:protein kinase [Myxococcales bacterium]MCB9750435.1 protein kinase [Myxococcales bacterium]
MANDDSKSPGSPSPSQSARARAPQRTKLGFGDLGELAVPKSGAGPGDSQKGSRGATIASFGPAPQAPPTMPEVGTFGRPREPDKQAPKPAAVIPATALAGSASPFVSDVEPGLSPAADDFQANRATRVGTQLGGMQEVVPASGTERARIRLVAGKPIPGTRYRLLRWLGEGGMGVVYEAEHVDIERKVALKILRFDLSQQPEMARVFRDEARSASRMGSTNIVEIFDFGELPDGRLFFCMELLDGVDLVPQTEHDWVQPPVLIGILRQLCKGLNAAHKAGVVHRDIKPENVILVHREGRDGVVKIVDFGISAMLAAGGGEGAKVAGTPHYMAPEQISSDAFDGRLDMYAVGCMAYELLVGHPPFAYDELEQVLAAHLQETPVPPSKIKPERDIPKPLEQVLLRCLEKDPNARYEDMADLEAALCEAQIAAGIRTDWDDLPLPEVDPDRVERLRQQMPSPRDRGDHKRAWLWPLVAGFSILLAISAGVYAYIAPDLNDEQKSVIEELTDETRKAAALTHYVSVPKDAAVEKSAYQRVLELEELPGALDDPGDDRAGELRKEIAGTLIALGDKYWDADVKKFAVEYYIWARAFDPANQHAIDRSMIATGEFALFLEKAANGTWTANELQAFKVASALAEEDEAKRAERYEDALADAQESLRSAANEDDKKIRRASGIKQKPKPPEPEPDETTDTGEDNVVEDSAGDTEGEDSGEDDSGGEDAKAGGKSKHPTTIKKSKRDPAQSSQLASDGKAALKSGRRKDAEALFFQAIAFDNNNAMALSGLSDIYFDTGQKQKAVDFAERAVKASPKSKAYNLKLGDAYYVVLRYHDALAAYEKAKQLGSDAADSRIAKVKAKIGG